MFHNQFVMSLKYNGKIIRDQKNEVFIPFGSNYSLLMKNLSNRKVVVNLFIDGQHIFNNSALIMKPKSDIELDSFDNNKFIFYEKTNIDNLKDFYSNDIRDSIIRVEYNFEYIEKINTQEHVVQVMIDNKPTWIYNVDSNGTMFYYYETYPTILDECEKVVTYNNDSKGSIGLLENSSDVIELIVKGIRFNKKITSPIYTHYKLVCDHCNRKNNNNSVFCSNCGSILY